MATLGQANQLFQARHGTHKLAALLIPRLVDVYAWFFEEGLSERKFEAALKAGHDPEYAQNLSEMLVAYRLYQAGFALKRSSSKGGPDFVAMRDGLKIQVEVVTPEALPEVEAYLNRPKASIFSVPQHHFLMCWTKGIAAKAKQLLGDGELHGWREKQLVDDHAPFVIAVNGCLFAGSFDEGFRSPLGGHPRAATALYAISDPTIQFDPNTGKRLWAGFQQQKELPRTDKGPIPLDSFLDEAYAPVSALWTMALDATDLLHDEPIVLPRQNYASAVLHNPNANVSLAEGEIPAYEEWAIRPDPEGYALTLVRKVSPE